MNLSYKTGGSKLKLKIENDSGWNFWDNFDKTVKELIEDKNAGFSEQGYKHAVEETLLRFLRRLPSGDYSNLINEWNERD